MFTRSYIKSHVNHKHFLPTSRLLSYRRGRLFKKLNDKDFSLYKSLSDPTKYKIIFLLSIVEEIAVSDIVHVLRISQSAASHALSDLKNAGLVESNRCGKLICYRLAGYLKNSKLINALI